MSHASVEAGSASDPVKWHPSFRCPECRCREFARVDEKKPNGSFGPGPMIRCVECKRTYRSPDPFAALARSPAPAVPESVRLLLNRLASASRWLADFPPDGLVKGDLYAAAKNEGSGSGWRYLATGVTFGDLDEAASLLASDPPSGRAGEETAPAPAGVRVVPESGWVADEPTPEMYAAARDWSRGKYGMPIGNEAARGCWQAMLWHAPVDLCALVAAPKPAPASAPAHGSAESEGWCFDMEAAPRDGTIVLLWRERWGEPSAAYWGLAPLAVSAEVATKLHPWVFLDSTNGLNSFEDSRDYGPTAWRPLPSPPATQPATPAEGR